MNFIKIKIIIVDIEVIEDGNVILDTGGGILNIINQK